MGRKPKAVPVVQDRGWLVSRWEHYGNPRETIGNSTMRDGLFRFVESLKRFLYLRVAAVVSVCNEFDVIAEEYQSDCAPMSTVHRERFTVEEKTAVRSGHSGKDFLVERYFIKVAARPTGPARVLFLTRDPVPMTEGKTAMAHFACFQSFGYTLRQRGFRGLNIASGKWDRAVFGPMKRLLFAWHRKVHADMKDAEGKELPEWQREALWLKFWLFCIPCSAHDAHNALKWGLYSQRGLARGPGSQPAGRSAPAWRR